MWFFLLNISPLTSWPFDSFVLCFFSYLCLTPNCSSIFQGRVCSSCPVQTESRSVSCLTALWGALTPAESHMACDPPCQVNTHTHKYTHTNTHLHKQNSITQAYKEYACKTQVRHSVSRIFSKETCCWTKTINHISMWLHDFHYKGLLPV